MANKDKGEFQELEDGGEQVAEGETPGEEGKGRQELVLVESLRQQVGRST